MLYKIIPDTKTTNTLLVSPNFQTKFLSNPRKVIVYAGANKWHLRVRIVPDQDIDTVTISSNALAELSIPGNLRYQVRRESKGVRLGPVLGLLVTRHKNKLKNNLETYVQHYTDFYPQTYGLLYLFTLEGINFSTNTVEGYYFDPANKLARKWVKGVFPFPDAMFRRIRLSNDVRSRLQEITNCRLFNSYQLDKWDYWACASKCESIRRHLPETRKLSSSDVLAQMLARYDAVVLKPILGGEGSGFIMVKKTSLNYSVQKKPDRTPTIFGDEKEMLKYIRRITKNRPYLVQQAVDLLKFDDRYTDFRVIMQKDFSCRWQCVGIITSMGAVGGICSNYDGDVSIVLSFEEFFSRYLGISSAEIAQKKQEVIETCTKACEALDQPGFNYGDVGIDLAIDTSLNLWILEINPLHLEEMLLYIEDEDAYNAVHLNRIQYLTALSGFNILLKSNKKGF